MTSLQDLSRLSTEATLSLEEKALLSNGIRGLEAARKGEYLFWGKIFGRAADYLVVSALFPTRAAEETNHLDKQFYFCTTADMVLKPLEHIPSTHNAIIHNFTGQPDTEIVAPTQAIEEEEEATPAYLEKDHLSYVVNTIDTNTSVVPAGSFILDAYSKVKRNELFSGCANPAVATDLNSYYHLRQSQDPAKQKRQAGLALSESFLDSIGQTALKGAWSVQLDPSKSKVTIRSMLYPGYSFYHEIEGNCFGGFYVGDGKYNQDVAFML